MPKIPAPTAIVAAVALALFCVSALDALSVVWDVREGQRSVAAGGRSVLAAARLEGALVRATESGMTTREAAVAVAPAIEVLRAAEKADDNGPHAPRAIDQLERLLVVADQDRPVPLAEAIQPIMEFSTMEGREQEQRRRRTEELTSRAVLGDGLGMLGAVVLGLLVWARSERRRRRGKPAEATEARLALPVRAPFGEAIRPAAGRAGAGPVLDDGPSADQVADAVNRVRRQVHARYTHAQADRDQLAAIVDTAFDAFIGVDGEGRITRWNPRAEQLFGWSREEAIGRPVLGTALGPPRGRGPLSPTDLRSLVGSRFDEPAELVAWHRSGRSFPVEVALSLSPERDDGSVHAFVRDISRRRRTERRERTIHAVTRALAEHETVEESTGEILRLLCETYDWSAACAWAVDPHEGRLRLLHAYAADGTRMMLWRDACQVAPMVPGAGLPAHVWQSGAIAYRETQAALPEDGRAPAAERAGLRSVLCLPLTVDGETIGVLELLASMRRPLDNAVLDDLVAVQHVVAGDLARRHARAATERAKREFLTLVSHELRTPLTSILGYLQMLGPKLGAAGPAEQRSIEIIKRNADRLHRLVGDLLFAAEISRGELGLDPGTVCMKQIVLDAADAARPVAAGRDVEIVASLDPVGVVEGDAGRLSQVLDNLISNAVKFSHEGGRVELRLRQDELGVAVEVCDEGIGVGAADVERLSQQFFRASTARAAKVSGMGLGLSLSKAIVESHGGELRFASVEGKGTTVTVRLPATPAAPAALAA